MNGIKCIKCLLHRKYSIHFNCYAFLYCWFRHYIQDWTFGFLFDVLQKLYLCLGCPGGTNGKEPACQSRRHKRCGLDPWVWKSPWRRAWQPTPVFLPGESLWAEESDVQQSIGSQRVRHDWSDLAHACTISTIWLFWIECQSILYCSWCNLKQKIVVKGWLRATLTVLDLRGKR